MLYSERKNGAKPRIKEDICHSMWRGIVSILNTLESQNYFAESFPEICPDSDVICGTDPYKIENVIEAYLDLKWPLQTHIDGSWYGDKVPFVPSIEQVFDLLEFLFQKVSKSTEYDYHSFFRHSHLTFDKHQGEQYFINEFNALFRIRGMIYEINEIGHVVKVLDEETKTLIQNIVSYKSGDIELDEMLKVACQKISSYSFSERYHALEKLWDAWERLKNLYDIDKKQSTNIIISKFNENAVFSELIEKEMRQITEIGNTYRIRHSEPRQATLSSHDQIDYLFHRCLATINIILKRMLK